MRLVKGIVVGDPIDAARVRASVRARLFGGVAAPVRLGRLELGERIGVGAMGVVYEARDPELGRKVAVKVLRPGLAAGRLHDEARALGQLRHPNVVAVHDIGVHEGHVFLVMERVDGESLRRHLAQPRPWREVVELFVAVARGVAAAHAVGLVHRDVKPDNVLVDGDGTVKVVDFGLSVEEGADAAPAGTPAYLAPEVVVGGEITAAADQFALGAALREALDGRGPDWLRRVVDRMTAEAPAARFDSVAEASAALRRGLDRRRRLWLLAGSALLVSAGAAVAVAVVQLGGEAPASCDGGAAELAEAWNSARRGEVITALGGDDAARGAAAHLDDYANGWIAMHRDSCLATRRGKQSAQALDLRARCLDRLRGELDATVARLGEVSAEEQLRSLSVVAGLPPIGACAELQRLEAATPLPDQPAQRAAILELQAGLAAAWADFRFGRYQLALTAVTALAPRARELAWRPLEADVLLLLGQAQRHGEEARVEDTLFDAVKAAEAGGHLEALATGQTLLAQHLSGEPATQKQAQQWLDLARATLERAGDAPALRAQVLDNQGRLEGRRGEMAAAKLSFEAAVAAERAMTPIDDTLLAMSLGNLGLVLNVLGDVAGSRAAYEESLALRERSLGAEHPLVADTMSDLADEIDQQGDHEQAATLFGRAAAIATKVYGAGSKQELRYLNYQGQALRDHAATLIEARRFDDARATLTRAIDILDGVPEAGGDLAGARLNVARVLAATGDAAGSIAEARAARALAATAEDTETVAEIDAFLAGK